MSGELIKTYRMLVDWLKVLELNQKGTFWTTDVQAIST